jgi:O-antigen/teichoic acid export membrane protein
MAGGAVMSGAARALVTVTGAATTIVVTRLLGPRGFGVFAVAQTFIAILIMGSTLGIEHGIVYYVSSGKWHPARAFRDSQRLAVVCGLIGACAGTLARVLFPGAFHGLSIGTTAIAAAALPFALSWLYGAYVALATAHYEAYVLPSAIQSTLTLALVGVLAAVQGIAAAVVGLLVAHVITAAGRYHAVRRLSNRRPAAGATPPGQVRHAVAFGIKGYASNALQTVNYRLDLFILNATVASAIVGSYSLAVSLTSILWLMPQALSDVLFPRIAALSSGSAASESERLRIAEIKGLRHCVLATVVGVVGCALALALLVVPIYGRAFRSSITLGFILLPGVALLAIANPLSAMVVGRGNPGLMLTGAIIVTPLTVLLYVLLIPSLHANGAALASSVSYAISFAFTAVFYSRVTGSSPLRSMWPTRSELADYRALLHRRTGAPRPQVER